MKMENKSIEEIREGIKNRKNINWNIQNLSNEYCYCQDMEENNGGMGFTQICDYCHLGNIAQLELRKAKDEFLMFGVQKAQEKDDEIIELHYKKCFRIAKTEIELAQYELGWRDCLDFLKIDIKQLRTQNSQEKLGTGTEVATLPSGNRTATSDTLNEEEKKA